MGEVKDGFRQGRMEGRIAAVRRSAPSASKLKITFAIAVMAAMVQNAWSNLSERSRSATISTFVFLYCFISNFLIITAHANRIKSS